MAVDVMVTLFFGLKPIWPIFHRFGNIIHETERRKYLNFL